MNKTTIKFGVIIGLLNTLWLYSEFMFGLHNPKNIELFSKITPLAMLIPVVVLVLYFLKSKKENTLSSKYFKRLLQGILAASIAAVISSIGQFIYHAAVNPHYFDSLIEIAKSKGTENPEQYFNTVSYVIQVFISNLFIGAITSAIASIFIKPKTI